MNRPAIPIELAPRFWRDDQRPLTLLGRAPDLVFVIVVFELVESNNLNTGDALEVRDDRVAHRAAFAVRAAFGRTRSAAAAGRGHVLVDEHAHRSVSLR